MIETNKKTFSFIKRKNLKENIPILIEYKKLKVDLSFLETK